VALSKPEDPLDQPDVQLAHRAFRSPRAQ
jgi:hypothetical protein